MTAAAATGSDRPAVAIWRTDWLPASETFIVDQIAALARWRPITVGLRRVTDGFPIIPDLAPFDRRVLSRAAHRADAILGYRFPYDRWLARHEVRVLHAHFGPGAIRVLPIAMRNRLPLVATFHGFDATSEPARTDEAGRRYRAGLVRLFSGCTRLIAVSEFIAERLIELGAPESKVIVHHIGVPTDRGPQFDDRSRRSGITFVGRLREQKGIRHLIEAVAALPDDLRSSTPVRVIGTGELRAELGQLADRRRVNVQWLGRLSPEQVAVELEHTAVFCGPSITHDGATEGFGTVYLEAALHSAPVVAYASGGVVESVANGITGLLVPEGDVVGLSGQLRTLLTDTDRARQLGRAGRERVLRSFDIRQQTAELERIYDETIADSAAT
ncbi:Glycosyltransferase involved in cell wall bisynthesis [Nakamurella panacisegetis]|uniref:Glycosyltransferase involved in cell wall bisynthesis n=1 Tax=Nakamurella panacisegetis TaxID=1090615 RepID=A0A1H0IIW3_9ACTN|nr:glycosyltransferase [Nakamurella panacisegetis]SDO31295.1 Glycosyltransferase involved in cell wall bisynthesis [Nakamurella panacisegetis]